jgi:hypothetical protein
MILVAPKFLKFIQWVFRMNMQIGGLAINPFIFVAAEHLKNDKALINHERIHLRQQKELLFLGFVVLYFIALYRKGYMGISFEKEAYQNMYNLKYLDNRRWFAWTKYL